MAKRTSIRKGERVKLKPAENPKYATLLDGYGNADRRLVQVEEHDGWKRGQGSVKVTDILEVQRDFKWEKVE